MKASEKGDLHAFVQTAEQAGDYVWVIALVDFDARELKRAIVSDETYTTRAAAKDAGDARLKALEQDRHAPA
ncbi:hypothetical protein J8I87_21290 [Paraburkholderia sp. LEh10]|uniref:hypothetical protein n=1 Tax=Paraburkholderia sp. LEh10 TaxID=2821353 RepID=UPI001AE690DB|nr:hypothetical protein [Paraburkholderia sp. LEh10]MBP0592218.1 hypothetical protein [Paraburkholderia sp. LEh10]